MIKYKEILFLSFVSIWMLITCWRGLFQPLYWDSAYSLANHAKRMASSLDLRNYKNYNFQDDSLLPRSLINNESNYPHTFGTALFYAIFYILFPKNYLIVWHFISLIISIGFLIVLYALIKKICSKFEAFFFVILMATNPLFLAQTVMIYHEIPGALFRYLSIYFLLTNKNKLFLFSSIIAFLIRFENGPILFLLATARYLFLKKWQFSPREFKKNSLNMLILFILIIFWFVFHKYLTGWTLISPSFGHFIDQKQAYNTTFSFLFYDQGRKLMSLTILLMLVINFNKFIKNKKTIILFLISTIFFFITPLYLGTTLNRYSISVLPIYYFFLIIGLSFNKKSTILNIFSIIILSFLINHQIQFLYKCHGNFETCLNVVEWIDLKKQIAVYLEKNIEPNDVVYVNWDEVPEFSDSERFSGSFCQSCVNALDYPNDFDFKEQNINQYILISPNTDHLIKELTIKNDFKLIENFGKNEFETKLYKIEH